MAGAAGRAAQLVRRAVCTTAQESAAGAVHRAKSLLASELKRQSESVAGDQTAVEEQHKLFVNTELDLAQIRCYGFDYVRG